MGAFDHLKWTYDEAFEQLFGPGRGDLNKNFKNFKCLDLNRTLDCVGMQHDSFLVLLSHNFLYIAMIILLFGTVCLLVFIAALMAEDSV